MFYNYYVIINWNTRDNENVFVITIVIKLYNNVFFYCLIKPCFTIIASPVTCVFPFTLKTEKHAIPLVTGKSTYMNLNINKINECITKIKI